MSIRENYRYDIAALRIFCVLVVVAYHGYLKTYNGFLGEELTGRYGSLYAKFNDSYLINLAMPLFVYIAGLLFGTQLLTNRKSLKEVAISKGKRLILPYLVFTAIFVVLAPIGGFMDLVTGDYWHLWFLPTLFWCFIIGYIIAPLLFSEKWYLPSTIIVILLAFSLLNRPLPRIMGLGFLNAWLCWFAIGMYMAKIKLIDTICTYKYLYISVLIGGVECMRQLSGLLGRFMDIGPGSTWLRHLSEDW